MAVTTTSLVELALRQYTCKANHGATSRPNHQCIPCTAPQGAPSRILLPPFLLPRTPSLKLRYYDLVMCNRHTTRAGMPHSASGASAASKLSFSSSLQGAMYVVALPKPPHSVGSGLVRRGCTLNHANIVSVFLFALPQESCRVGGTSTWLRTIDSLCASAPQALVGGSVPAPSL